MVQADRIKTVAIVGCTAVGKSETALKLAHKFNGELVGADSMQIYRGFDIGTGKLTKAECGGIIHRLIDVADGDAEFSVGDYVQLAKSAINDIASNGKLPIIVGGTGMYVYSLLSGCNFANTPKNDDIRNALKLSAHFLGAKAMHGFLTLIDKQSADKISQNDVKRTIRALEIFAVSGLPKSTTAAYSQTKPYDDLTVVLTLPRELLYERINARVKRMFDSGLIDETMSLMRYKGHQAMQALGYKQIVENTDMGKDELISLVAQKTRNYAKRQMTYFNNMKLNKVYIDARDYNKIENCVGEFIRGTHE